MHVQEELHALERVMAEMLVVNRVVLERLDQRYQVVRLGDEDPIVCEQGEDAFHDIVDALDVCEYIGRGDDTGLSAFIDHTYGRFRADETQDRPNATLVGR